MESKYNINLVKFGNTPQLPYSIEEAINRLRINISFLGSDIRKIMIISSEPNEGKSFVAINLWNQMAEAGEKAILVDAGMNMKFYPIDEAEYERIRRENYPEEYAQEGGQKA